jgi:large subunit ribosomal protein L29
MKIKEMRSMSKEDLNTKLEELKKELIKVNAQIATGTTPKSPGHVKQIKKNIARILTIIHKKPKEVDSKT